MILLSPEGLVMVVGVEMRDMLIDGALFRRSFWSLASISFGMNNKNKCGNFMMFGFLCNLYPRLLYFDFVSLIL